MTLDNVETVDAVGIERATGDTVLTILDSWDWRDEHEHLLALQNKINAYLHFVESGQIWTSYPLASGTNVTIDILTRFPLTPSAEKLVQAAREAASQLRVSLRQRCA